MEFIRTYFASRALQIGALGAIFIILGGAWYTQTCTNARIEILEESSHGYRTWDGETIKSFLHTGRRVCVPPEWRALGALEVGSGWAKFEKGKSGVLIRVDAFSSEVFEPIGSRFKVEVFYPNTVSIEPYRPLILRIFEKHAELFETEAREREAHTLLITYKADSESLYPDPSRALTILTRAAEDPRGKELAYHAVAHLYNRFSGVSYNQPPFSEGDFEELVAAWSEISLMDSNDVRRSRVDYLYRVHSAVMTKDYSLIKGPPFNDPEAFQRISPTMLVPASGTYLDYQYGHYILAPLVAVSLDGMLAKYDSSVFSILQKVHEDETVNFMDEVKRLLSAKEYETLLSFVRGDVQIPWDAVSSGLKVYSM